MVWGLNKKSSDKIALVSLSESDARLLLVEKKANKINVLTSDSFSFDSPESLREKTIQWVKDNKCKGLDNHWLLSRKLYKTLNVKPPSVPDSELDNAVKWLIKDQIEQPLDKILTAQYKPHVQENETEKLTAVVIEKAFIENLIEISDEAGLDLKTIEINELATTNALKALLDTEKPGEEKIVGFIDEDNQGLIYNFYVGHSLAFTRHIKGRFFPIKRADEFSLETENLQSQQDQFLLETQRTLDYCVSQVFRKPVNLLVLDSYKTDNEELLIALEQVTEIPCQSYRIDNSSSSEHSKLQLTLAEGGVVLHKNLKQPQSVNFYLTQYQPKPLEFGFKFATAIAALFLLMFIGYGFIQNKEQQQLKQQLVSNNNELNKIQISFQEIQKSRGKIDPMEDLNNQISRKQNELVTSNKLLARVTNQTPIKPINYSEVLAALSKQKISALWLTKINLNQNIISLTGQTTKPTSIPIYIDAMADDSVLRSQFEDLQIERDLNDSRVINFSINNGHYKNAD